MSDEPGKRGCNVDFSAFRGERDLLLFARTGTAAATPAFPSVLVFVLEHFLGLEGINLFEQSSARKGSSADSQSLAKVAADRNRQARLVLGVPAVGHPVLKKRATG